MKDCTKSKTTKNSSGKIAMNPNKKGYQDNTLNRAQYPPNVDDMQKKKDAIEKLTRMITTLREKKRNHEKRAITRRKSSGSRGGLQRARGDPRNKKRGKHRGVSSRDPLARPHITRRKPRARRDRRKYFGLDRNPNQSGPFEVARGDPRKGRGIAGGKGRNRAPESEAEQNSTTEGKRRKEENGILIGQTREGPRDLDPFRKISKKVRRSIWRGNNKLGNRKCLT